MSTDDRTIPDTPRDAEAAQAIAAASASLDRALVSGNPDEVSAHFTHDAVLGESGAPDAVGRAAIREFLVRGNQQRTVTHHRLIRVDLVVLEDRAIEFGLFDEVKVLSGGESVVERGRTVTDWRRDADGSWKIARLVVSDLPA